MVARGFSRRAGRRGRKRLGSTYKGCLCSLKSKTLIGTHARVEPWDPCVCRIVIPESRVAAFIRSECSSLPLSRFLAGVGVLVYHAAACFPFPGAESRPREGTPQGVRRPAQLAL